MRIMRTAKRMGIATVAVFSEADRFAPHVLFSDEAVCIGPAPSSHSYLRSEKIIEIALQTGADAIHPGYGFLSENAGFSEAVEKAGLIFIGPSAESIRVMGSKLAAKEAVKKFQIPMVPGSGDDIKDEKEALEISRKIGFPVLIKASAGGGGKGMRIVHKETELASQMDRAVSEAVSAFGDGAVFIEKYINSPRHIEFQILSDKYGNTIHLFERECSVQRRHQKVIEEAPSAVLTPAVRVAMGMDAVKVAKACNYTGAGTVEFLVDEKLNYYFLEMNTRLQVEHPVTEAITGIDLVEQQIRIARGEILGLRQENLPLSGHAIELRVYAEDPFNDFLPSIGKLNTYKLPKGDGIRVDEGYRQGMDIPIYYDPMISKLIAWGSNRHEAIDRLLHAIEHYEIEGVATTLPFGKFVLKHEAFVSGLFDTHFVQKYFTEEKLLETEFENSEIAAKLALKIYLEQRMKLREPVINGSKWRSHRKH